MLKFLVLSAVVAVALARPDLSMLRPAQDNSGLLKPAVESLPSLVEAIRPIIRPLPVDLSPIIIDRPILSPGVMPLPVEEAPKAPMVQIILNVADPNLVQIIGPEQDLSGIITKPNLLPAITKPNLNHDLTKPNLGEDQTDLTKPNLSTDEVAQTFPLIDALEEMLRPQIGDAHLLRPSEVDQSDLLRPVAVPVYRPATDLIR